MKRLFGLVIGVLVLLFAAQAWAQSRPQNMYLSGNIGFGIRPDSDINISTLPFENDPAFVINGAVGVELNPMIRAEGEIGFHLNSADQGGTPVDWTFSTISFMGNGYFDIPTNSPVRPYVGAGLGLALVQLEGDAFGVTADDSDLVGAFQLMAGLGFDISPRATLTFGYRYFVTTDPTFSSGFGSFETEYTSHDFLFGARFRF
ncbi:MAG: porin family protein [Nitrospinota bacterium]|nr:porin family protein [Nitrospinota bacterium]